MSDSRIERAKDSSATLRTTKTARERVGRSIEHSKAASVVTTARDVLALAGRKSRFDRTGRRLGGPVRASWLYRRLTTEPEPEVIVIDLRETYTVGPIVAALDWLVEALAPAWARSRLRTAADETATRVRRAPVRAAGIVTAVAVSVDLLATGLLGSLSPAGVTLRAGVLALALLGTRVGLSWDELAATRAARLIAAVLEPPEPPTEDGAASDDGSDDPR